MDDERPTADAVRAPEEQEEGRRPPTWVYLVLLMVLVAILLGVESVLNWLTGTP